MAKVTLSDLQNLNNKVTAVNTINANSNRIEEAMEKTLSRTGDSPNEMQASLDMNNFPIYNLPKATSPTEPVRKIEFDQLEIAQDVTALLDAVADAEEAADDALVASGSATLAANTATAQAAIAVQAAQDAQSVSGLLTTFATRSAAIAATISVATNYINTEGYSTAGDGGGGHYARVVSQPSHAGKFQSADGAWWELRGEVVYPKQFGAKLDNTTDDTTAVQGWLDYATLFRVTALGQSGSANIPTGTISVGSNFVLDGRDVMSITRNTNPVAYLVNLNGSSYVTIKNLTLNHNGGFSSTSSNTVANGSQSYTITAGLVGVQVGKYVQLTSSSAPANYMIGLITGYTGTTLSVTVSTAVGSGTYNDWRIDMYPDSGGNPGNVGFALAGCSNVTIDNCKINGRFYHGLETRNGTKVTISNNRVTGYVNRGISVTSYTGADVDTTVIGNVVWGEVYAQYGINCAAISGASNTRTRIIGNSVWNTLFQGISVGGNMFSPVITGNNVWLTNGNSVGSCILVQLVDGTYPQLSTISGNACTLGLYGVYVESAYFATISGNTTSFCAYGIYYNNGSEAVITGNNIRGASATGITTSSGTSLISITGNRATSYSIGGSGHGTAGNI